MDRIIKILHLEDIPSDSELINMELNKASISYEHKVVDTKTEFINALQEFNPDVVLADHSLTTFNSLEALKIVNSGASKIPFLLVTSSASENFVEEIMREGAKGYILKNNLDKLPDAIAKALEETNTGTNTFQTVMATVTEEKLYDLKLLEEMEDYDYLVEIVSIFLNETPKELKEMQICAIAKKNFLVSGKAHKLKSSCGLLEATGLLRILEEMERLAKIETTPADHLVKLSEAAVALYYKVEVSLQNYLKNIPQH